MAERFNLTAQLQLQAPTNTGAVITQIRRQLKGLTVDVKVKSNVAALSKTNKELQSINKSAQSSSKSMGQLNRTLSDSARRFSVITVATGTMLSLARAFKNSVGEAIAFERELVRISQVTGKSVQNLQGLTREVTRLATALGASSKDLLNVSRVLAQAGFDAQKTSKALEILAQTSLGATFNSIQDTTEGAIAVLRQFRKEARAAGGEIKFLEQTLDAINAVSKRFAVESGDLITVIRRVGGVFEAAGGSVNELIALFTSVRATTRESAETIATGLRTIFTRIQRTETIDQLKSLGIVLQDSQGKFVGAFEAINRLSRGLSALDPRDFRFNEIVEQLGGFRQIGKVIPLIRQFTTAQDALNVAQGASGSVARDAATAQQSLAVQVQRVREDFDALIRKFADSSTFRAVANGALEIARAFIRVAEAIEPILPLVTSLIALKIGRSLAPGLASIAGFGGGARGRATGGRIHKFARGGFVPGTGNRDTVPAMLQPGEFVIRKSSAAKLGSNTLEAMNNNRFNDGGKLRKELSKRQKTQALGKDDKLVKSELGELKRLQRNAEVSGDDDIYAAAFLRPEARGETFKGKNNAAEIKKRLESIKGYSQVKKDKNPEVEKIFTKYASKNTYTLKAGSLTKSAAEGLEDTLLGGVVSTIKSGAKKINSDLKIQGVPDTARALKSANIDQTMGNIFESVLNFAGAPFGKGDSDAPNAPFDFGKGLQGAAKPFGLPIDAKAEAKTFFTEGSLKTIISKVNNENIKEAEKELRPIITSLAATRGNRSLAESRALLGLGSKATAEEIENSAKENDLSFNKVGTGKYKFSKKAMGGKIDSVPALLTPGEFVVKKSAAQSIGYGNLNKMNQTGVQRFNTGGVVQRFETGGSVKSGDFGLSSAKDVALVNVAARQNATAFRKLTAEIEAWQPEQARAALIAFARNINATSDEAVLLDKSIEAAHRSATQFGPGAKRPKDAGIKGVSKVRSGGEAETRKAGGIIVTESGKVASILKKMGASSRDVSKGLDAYRQSIAQGNTQSRALKAALQASAKSQGQSIPLINETHKARKSFIQRLQAAGKSISAGIRGPSDQQGLERRQAGAQKAGEVAGQVQQAAFFLSMVGSTAVQLSGLSDAAKKAATETLAMAGTGLTFIATIVQMGASVMANIAAVKLSTLAHGKEAASVSKSSLGKLGGAFAGAAAGAAAVAAAFYYHSAKTKAQADELAEATNKSLNQIKEGKGGGAAGIKSNISEELALRGDSGAASGAAMMAGVVGTVAGTAAGFAAAGAAAGSVVPVIGTLVGAVAGAAAGYGYYVLAGNKAAKAAERQAEALNTSVDRLVSLYKSTAEFDRALKAIDMADLAPEERVERRLTAQSNMEDPTIAASGALSVLSVLARQAGKNINQLSEKDFEEAGYSAYQLKLNQDALSHSMETAAKKIAETRKTLDEASKIELTGERSFDEIMQDPLSNFAKALRDAQQAIQDEAQIRMQLANSTANAFRQEESDILNKVGGDESKLGTEEKRKLGIARANAQAEEEKSRMIRKQSKQAQDDLKKGKEQQSKSAEERVKADKALLASQQALAAQARRTAAALNETVDLQRAINNWSNALDDFTAITEEKAMKWELPVPQGLSDLSMVGDQAQFNKDVDDIAKRSGDPAVKEQAKIVKQTSALLQKGAGADLSKVPRMGFDNEQAQKMLNDVFGPELKSLIGPEMFDQMAAELKKAAKGGLSPDEWAKILAPLEEFAEGSTKVLKKHVEMQNQMLGLYSKHLQNLQARFDKENELRIKFIDVQSKGLDLRAKARGQEVSPALQDSFRQQKAQTALAGVRGPGLFGAMSAGMGEQVQAGDVGAVSRARDAAKAELENIKQKKAEGKVTQELMDREAQMLNIVKKTGAELDRLADQSAKAGNIMGQISKERVKREQATSVITDFVVGGADQRQGMIGAAMGVDTAVRTGTLQNQTEEQRSATVGMLDKLSEVVIGGTGGLTGKQVKQELVFQDAIRMGLDPEVAKQLALGTSKEEQLINALDRLTHQMEQAAAARLTQPVTNAAFGGPIYASRGASIFKPRGTDTVPAMLTPGEFVIRKSAVDKIGVNNLEALNRSRGGVVYRQGGGGIGSGTAEFAGQAREVSIMSGEAYRAMFKESLRSIGLKKFLAILEKEYPTEKSGETFVKTVSGQVGSGEANEALGNTKGKDAKFRTRKRGGRGRGKSAGETDIFEKTGRKGERSVRKSVAKLLKSGTLSLDDFKFAEGTAQALDALVSSTDLIEKAGGGFFSLRVPTFPPNPDPLIPGVDPKALKAYRSRLATLASAIQGGHVGDKGGKLSKIADEITVTAGNPMVASMTGNVWTRLNQMVNMIDAAKNADGGMADIQNQLKGAKDVIKPSRKIDTVRKGKLKEAVALLRDKGLLFAQGGSVPGTDTVPAMLTPGEFVMNKSAVQTHGVGFMKNLNRGRVPGFRRGGLVGTGNVQYKQDGGSVANNGGGVISLDPSKVQGVLDNFNAQFSASLDNVVGVFSGFGDSLQQLVASFNGITMTHNVQVEGLISLGGLNVEAIKEELSTAIGTMVADQVSQTMDRQAKEFKSSG